MKVHEICSPVREAVAEANAVPNSWVADENLAPMSDVMPPKASPRASNTIKVIEDQKSKLRSRQLGTLTARGGSGSRVNVDGDKRENSEDGDFGEHIGNREVDRKKALKMDSTGLLKE